MYNKAFSGAIFQKWYWPQNKSSQTLYLSNYKNDFDYWKSDHSNIKVISVTAKVILATAEVITAI